MSTSGKAAGGPPTGAAGGDIAGTGTSTYPNPTLTALGAATGPIGSTTVTPVVTIDTKGRVTALTQATITPPGISVATVTLNTAAIKAMFSSPTTVVAAPGAGKVLVVHAALAQLKPTTGTLGGPPRTQGFHYGTPAVAGARAASFTAPDIVNGGTAATATVAIYIPASSSTLVPLGNAIAQTAIANQAITFGAELADQGNLDLGAIVTSTLASGGTGYVIGDTGTIDIDFFGGAAAYVIDTVAAVTGAVLTYHLTAGGDGYSTADNPLLTTAGGAQPGVGVNFTVNATAVTPFAANLYATLYYTTLTLT